MSNLLNAFLGQQQRLRQIVSKYRANPNDVDELVQETFALGLAHAQNSTISQPDRFLKKIAKNLAITQSRRKSNTNEMQFDDIDQLPLDQLTSAMQDEKIHIHQQCALLQKLIDEMPETIRESLILRRIEGYSYKAIASKLGTSVSTVEKRVAKALVLLYSGLKANGVAAADYEDISSINISIEAFNPKATYGKSFSSSKLK
ncbi:ECF subfamily RNA polymerase sigma-24 subunit [Catenovulum agarivorans DS-2]|uniref:ECF subfamily RNA polymerase sigma-24 subunit n=1 Tax=Catenovulum agarivorans DS-2 TaxID=1328313 RepID=W7Q8S9_9ALTE|nr:RNA polymerase sigma factor [Catenovulum agarivorans]EWH09224.1 ECF subfamily RNA polymerase sigma-24 subunit [Catenovulum agarivorans DS-2]